MAHSLQAGRTVCVSRQMAAARLEAIRKGKPEDNGMIESLHGHFKNDYVFIRETMSFAETKLMLADAVSH